MTYFDREKRLINKVGRIDTFGGDNTKMADKVIYESVHHITFRSRSRISSYQSRVKLIKFNDSKKGQAKKLVEDGDIMVNIVDISDYTNNCLPFENNVKYEWERFILASKMKKKPIIRMFFSNPTLVSM